MDLAEKSWGFLGGLIACATFRRNLVIATTISDYSIRNIEKYSAKYYAVNFYFILNGIKVLKF